MSSFERAIEHESYQDYLAEAVRAEHTKLEKTETIYQDVVEEWRGFHDSPASFEMGFTDMLAILKDTVTQQGVPVQDAHNFCVNAELEARFTDI